MAARRGATRAAVAVGHAILVIAYRVRKDGTVYQERGVPPADERHRPSEQQCLVARLEGLGFKVSLEPAA